MGLISAFKEGFVSKKNKSSTPSSDDTAPQSEPEPQPEQPTPEEVDRWSKLEQGELEAQRLAAEPRTVEGLAQGEHYPAAEAPAPGGEAIDDGKVRGEQAPYTGELGGNVAQGTPEDLKRTVSESGLFIPPPAEDGTPYDVAADPEAQPQPPPVGTRIDPRAHEQLAGGEAPLLPFLAGYHEDRALGALVMGRLAALPREARLALLAERTPLAVADAAVLTTQELENTVGQLLLQEVLVERAAAAVNRNEPAPQAAPAEGEPYGGDAPQHYVVLEDKSFGLDGQMVTLRATTIINDRTHNVDQLKQQGVKLIACEAPEPYRS